MKFKYLILSSLAAVQFANAQNTKDVKIHNDLSNAIEQVDTDGEFLQIEKSSDLLVEITKMLDKYALPEIAKSGEMPKDFSFVKILDLTGLNEITAGSKSVKKIGENYITKSFIQTNGSRKGIFSLLGKVDQPWASLEYAPANTELILETHLDLTAMPEMMKQFAPMIGKEEAKEMLDSLNEQEPIAGNTLEQILLQANARISLIVELDGTKTWGPPSQKLPVIHVTGRIDGIAKFLWENYGDVIAKQLPVTSAGNVHTIISPEPIPAPWAQLTPVLVIDTDKNHIWFSLSAKHLQACRDGKSTIRDNKNFQLANKHSKASGASRIYLSKQLVSLAAKQLGEMMKKDLSEPNEQQILTEVVKHLQNLGSISSCVSHDEKGILVNTTAPFTMRNSQLGNVQLIASLAGLSYGPIMKHLENSKRIEEVSQVKNIYSGLLGYMVENKNSFPDNLKQLADGAHLTEDFLVMKRRKLHYIKGLSPADGHKVILYTSPDKNGKVIFARVDGSVQAVGKAELEEMLEKQK